MSAPWDWYLDSFCFFSLSPSLFLSRFFLTVPNNCRHKSTLLPYHIFYILYIFTLTISV
ncbi:uncharacterized protein BDW43DRAFT_267228 [Aspergillus alliaceus]|uniref:uncharacterized protein n=1 Tax=Petromyces alliaceus TaxID=209559 RepID=UPI0012A4495E|nr:uncharacterized protein BDW43DRAFT_267228 [Aspergillus alliaceus]KAB8236581.1 hypothetical protein BDW43DRAFT_267228 [Aspergillus alliaceus]